MREQHHVGRVAIMPAGDDVHAARRIAMVSHEIAGRGVTNDRVLDAMRTVPREQFVPTGLAEFAYIDAPLPIDEGETISQPFIVAALTAAAEVTADCRVLEIGTGSGYGAAVLGHVAAEVWSIERHGPLVGDAQRRLSALGVDNVHVVHGDGSLGLPEHAPFDAIVVTGVAPVVPEALCEQLAVGGRLVVPLGSDGRGQRLLRIRRDGDEFVEEDLGPVRFVAGTDDVGPALVSEPAAIASTPRPAHDRHGRGGPSTLIREAAQPFDSIVDADLGPLLDRIGDCSVVLLGEASHGTSEFYRMRAHITRELITRKGFTVVAVEADWPDAARIDAHVRHRQPTGPQFEAFDRFPTWMWRNAEVRCFVEWLHEHNGGIADPRQRVSFHGLDIYSLFRSRDAVLSHLDRVDAEAAALARTRYSCLTPWEHDPASYGRAVLTAGLTSCEHAVVATLTDLLRRRLDYATQLGDDFIDAAQNALIVANAERYYRIMYHGSTESWNLRDLHMFETLQLVRSHRGPDAKIVVWEHNSHIGDASATEMGARGEHNVGLLTRRQYGADAFLVGFGTHDGRVAAASDWGAAMERKIVRPSHPDSYERLCHDADIPAFMLHLRHPTRPEVREELEVPRLERAIGVIYRPETELQSHYFQASLPHQFDEYVWFDRTSAIHPIRAHEVADVPDTYPFGL